MCEDAMRPGANLPMATRMKAMHTVSVLVLVGTGTGHEAGL
jgi:hypothetical protein